MKKPHKWVVYLLLSIVGTSPLFFYMVWFWSNPIGQPEDWGNFGDYISGFFGIVNTVLLIITFNYQIRLSYEQQFESTFFNLLVIHREARASFTVITRNGTLNGIDAISKISDRFEKMFEDLDEEFLFKNIKERKYPDMTPEFYEKYTRALEEKIDDLQVMDEEITEFRINGYLLSLTNMIKYVDNSSTSNKQKYIDLLLGQLFEDEQLILFVYSFQRFRGLENKSTLDKHSFFKYIEPAGAGCSMLLEMYFPLSYKSHLRITWANSKNR